LLKFFKFFHLIIIIYNNNNFNLTNSYWSIGSTMNVKEDRAQTREMSNEGHGNTVSMRLIRVDTRY